MSAQAPSTRIYLVDDSPAIRERLVEMIAAIPATEVVGMAETAEQAVSDILRQQPDCVVLDLRLLEGSGLDVLRRVHPDAPDIIFAVLTNHADSQYRRLCLAAGASYFYDKSTDVAQVRDLLAWLALKPRTH
ncbi:response regulator transcription factor [Chitinimonas sp.]|uniref:response regulator transcription factor n=1 Tax=Chitinimonas sp. TaxID=1934313 RepID=UPI002F9495B2